MMNATPEILLAINRINTVHEGDPLFSERQYRIKEVYRQFGANANTEYTADHFRLARAYLAEREGEGVDLPVDETWLRSIGFHAGALTESYEMRCDEGQSIDWFDGDMEVWDEPCNESVVLPGTYKTRRQVLNLLSALSIPVPTNANAKE